jgi:DNA topoisomerase-2
MKDTMSLIWHPAHARCAGLTKLDDANDAGGRGSGACTLILTEGDSAKSLVVAGMSVAGRDKFGVYPLRRGS